MQQALYYSQNVSERFDVTISCEEVKVYNIKIFDVINKIISCFIWRKHEILYLCSDLKYEDQNNLEQWYGITNHHASLWDFQKIKE